MKGRALVFKGEHYGTLSAMRSLGAAGIDVTLADARSLVPAALSRFLKSRVVAPDFENTDDFLSWMDDFGSANSGCFLYPVSDLSCWLFAVHGERLRKNFNLPYPGPEVISRILFKPELNRVAKSVGIACPETWSPVNEVDIAEIASRPDGDGYVVKPKTQLGQRISHKGFIVPSGNNLLREWTHFKLNYPSDAMPGLTDGHDLLPMIQRYVLSSQDEVVSVAGYINQGGTVFEFRGAIKTLQRPARMGIGMCFESYDVSQDLSRKVRNLCLALGYFGLFEAEFLIPTSGEPMIIDFNCRYYSQIGFDIKRGLDSVRLAYSNGNDKSAISLPDADHYRYALGWYLALFILTQTIMLRWDFSIKWTKWLLLGKGKFIDKIAVRTDPMPLIGDVISQVRHWIRYPRSSIKILFDI